MQSYHFVGISGSLRKASYNTALLRAAQSLLPASVTFESANIGELPLFNTELNSPDMLERVAKFRAVLQTADALVISSPEYNYSIPGILKNAIDWASRGKDSPLLNKPVAIMGASPGMLGTARMQMHLRQVFLYNNMLPVNKPEVFVSHAQTKFDSNGNLIDEKTRQTIRQQMEALLLLAKQTIKHDLPASVGEMTI
jgi:chromate reductase